MLSVSEETNRMCMRIRDKKKRRKERKEGMGGLKSTDTEEGRKKNGERRLYSNQINKNCSSSAVSPESGSGSRATGTAAAAAAAAGGGREETT